MKAILLTVTASLLMFSAFAQFAVGHTTITFNDSSRTGGFGSGGGPGRQIQSEIYYPAATAGEDVPVASGDFPVIAVGHGFVMTWDAYQNIWDSLVPQGYILVFPRTEGGFSPSHQDFGLDLVLCVDEMQVENVDMASLFYNHVNTNAAIMGHSMGGGATILAAASNSNIQTIVGLAPAETSPSAITAAPNVLVPSLILSGSSDGVTPPGDHHIPIYNGLNVSCKYFISVTGGAHCYFANSNFNCDFGEASASSGITVSRTDQQTILNDYLIKWMDYHLKGDLTAKTDFDMLLTSDSRITYMDSCSATPTGLVEGVAETDMELYPNPANGILNVVLPEIQESPITIYSAEGKLVLTQPSNQMRSRLIVSDLPSGFYTVVCGQWREQLVISR